MGGIQIEDDICNKSTTDKNITPVDKKATNTNKDDTNKKATNTNKDDTNKDELDNTQKETHRETHKAVTSKDTPKEDIDEITVEEILEDDAMVFKEHLTEKIKTSCINIFNDKISMEEVEKMYEHLQISYTDNNELFLDIMDKIDNNKQHLELLKTKVDKFVLEKLNKQKPYYELYEDINTLDKKQLWGKIELDGKVINNTLLSTLSEIGNFNIDNEILKAFYDDSMEKRKNYCGYYENDKINVCNSKDNFETMIFTKISNNTTQEPPGNYINLFLNKDLDIIKHMVLLQNSGYWIIQPCNNFINLIKKNNYYKDILSIYFIILKLLFCNNRYPFDSEDSIKKYINLSKTINLNLLMEVINNDKNFKNYIDNQLSSVFKVNRNIDDIVHIIDSNNINKYQHNILKLKFSEY